MEDEVNDLQISKIRRNLGSLHLIRMAHLIVSNMEKVDILLVTVPLAPKWRFGKPIRAPDTRVCIAIQISSKLTAHTLVDSGACRSLVRENFWKALCRACQRQPICREAENLRSLTGHSIDTKGRTMIELFGRFLEVTIVETLSHELLLGDDNLRTLGAIIDYNENVVHLGGEMLPCRQAVKEDLRMALTELEEWVMLRPDVFATEGTPNGRTPGVYMRIDTGSHPPIKQRPYRTP